MKRHVWMLSTYPTWLSDGYAARIMGESGALGETCTSVSYLRVLSWRAWRSRDRGTSRDAIRASGHAVIDVLQPPDLGIGAFRQLQRVYLILIIRMICIVWHIEILHAQGVRAGALAARTPRSTKVVVDVHGDIVAETAMAYQSVQNRRVGWASQETALALRRADLLVSVSPGMTRWLRALNAKTPIVEVPSGVDCRRFVPNFQRKAEHGSTRVRVLYLGTITAYQPAELIADCCHRVHRLYPNSEFQVIAPHRHENILAAFERLGLTVSISSSDAEGIPAQMATADIGIVPRTRHQVNAVASPTKIAEYLAAGVPVVCSAHVGVWASRLSDACVGVALESSDEELRDFIGAVSQNRELFRERCRSYAESEFDWSTLGQKLVSAYSLPIGESLARGGVTNG